MKLLVKIFAFIIMICPALVCSFEKDHVYFPVQLPQSSGSLGSLPAISLDLDYITIESKPYIINLAEPGHPLPKWGEVYVIKEQQKIDKILQLSGLSMDDSIILLSDSGGLTEAKISKLAYYTASRDAILVLAILKAKGADLPEATKLILGWRKGAEDEKPHPAKILQINKLDPDQCQPALAQCESGYASQLISGVGCFEITNAEPIFIMSFWHRPKDEFDIADLKTAACFAKGKEKSAAINLFPAIFPKYAFAPSEGNSYFVIGYGGSGEEACNSLLKYDSGRLSVVKQGLCVGY